MIRFDETYFYKPEDYREKKEDMKGIDLAIGGILLTIITLLCLDIIFGYGAFTK
jgi:hypothetical protein